MYTAFDDLLKKSKDGGQNSVIKPNVIYIFLEKYWDTLCLNLVFSLPLNVQNVQNHYMFELDLCSISVFLNI